MREYLLKMIYIVGIALFGLALSFAPFISITPAGGGEVTHTFADLVAGRSPYLMTGALTGALAFLPALPLAIALLIPRQTEDSTKLVNVLTIILFITFLLSVVYPALEAAAILLGSASITTTDFLVAPTWGTNLVIYLGLGMLIFIGLTMIPAVRKQITPPVFY